MGQHKTWAHFRANPLFPSNRVACLLACACVRACVCVCWGCANNVRESVLKFDSEEKPLPHRGIEPESVLLLAFRLDALSGDLPDPWCPNLTTQNVDQMSDWKPYRRYSHTVKSASLLDHLGITPTWKVLAEAECAYCDMHLHNLINACSFLFFLFFAQPSLRPRCLK